MNFPATSPCCAPWCWECGPGLKYIKAPVTRVTSGPHPPTRAANGTSQQEEGAFSALATGHLTLCTAGCTFYFRYIVFHVSTRPPLFQIRPSTSIVCSTFCNSFAIPLPLCPSIVKVCEVPLTALLPTPSLPLASNWPTNWRRETLSKHTQLFRER